MSSRKQITPEDVAILLVDHQPGVLNMVKSVPHKSVTANAGVLAKLGEDLGIPLVITSTRENLEFLGSNLQSVQDGAPIAYNKRIKRAGTLNAFHDPGFVEAVKQTNRKVLIISGLLTDVCLFHSVNSAIDFGYDVYVVADASGTTSELADLVTYDRLRSLGAEITTTLGILFELYSDLSKPEGLKAEGIASGALA